MVDSIARATSLPHQTLDIVLRDVVGTNRREASAARHDHEAHEILELAHGGATAAEAVSAGVELAEVGGLVTLGTQTGTAVATGGMTLGIVATYAGYVASILEGERRGVEWDSEMMRGALVALEGRLDDPDTRLEMAQNPAFADGCRAVERLFYSDNPRFMALATGIRAVFSQGSDAVYAGADSGPEFDARYEADLPFRHGVDAARALRDADPAAFGDAQTRARELRDAVRTARATAPIPG